MMKRPSRAVRALFAATMLPVASAAVAFEVGDDCVSPYVIADGDTASLRAAFVCANADGTDSTVTLAANGDYVFSDANSGTNKRALRSIGGDGLFTLQGNGATIRRDSGASEAFGLIEVGATGSAVLDDLMLTGANFNTSGGGGALRVLGNATAMSIRVVGNVASIGGGGIQVNGSLLLLDSTVQDNEAAFDGGGVAVAASGTLWMLRSTVRGNRATGTAHGGGLAISGVGRILNSTIVENEATGASRRGGGIYANVATSDVTVVNSTVFDNVSTEAGEQVRHASGTFNVYNSILGESVPDAIADCSNITALADTFVADGSCSATYSGTVGFLALVTGANGTEILPLDGTNASVLGAGLLNWLDEGHFGLDFNGDGDTDDDFSTDIDQSGKPRRKDGAGAVDLGAVEYVCGTSGTYYPSTADELVAAMNCANADGLASTIELLSEIYTLLEADNGAGGPGDNGLPSIVDDGDLTVNGHFATIERGGEAVGDFRLIHVASGEHTVVLNDLVLQGGALSTNGAHGGGIFNAGNLQLHRSVVRGNSVSGESARGGGIANRGRILISGSFVDSNSVGGAAGEGGGLDHDGGFEKLAVVVNSTISRNSVVDGPGGGIRAQVTELVMVNVTLADNMSATGGSQVAVSNGAIEAYNMVTTGASGSACSGDGIFLSYVIENSIASDASCGAQLTLDPQLDSLVSDGVFVPYFPLSGGSVDTVDFGSSAWLDEAIISVDLNGDGDQFDDLSAGTDQAGAARLKCSEVDVGAAEYAGCDASYQVGGTVTGLAAGNSVILTLNGSVSFEVTANGAFSFPPPLGYGQSYFVAVTTQPTSPNQQCSIGNPSGRVANGDVTSVSVSCTTLQYTVGGTVSGLAPGNSVVLQNNDGDDLLVESNGDFTFATPLDDGSSYAVMVLTQPTAPNQTCSVIDGGGVLAGGNVTDTEISCVTNQYTVGGTLFNLSEGNTVVLQNNDGDDLALDGNGSFVFVTALDDGSGYSVSVLTQPITTSQACTVINGAGTLAGAAVTSVEVHCVDNGIDLVASISDGATTVQAGMPVTYMIEIVNLGPVGAQGVAVQSHLSDVLFDATWDCLPGEGAACPDSGTGDIDVLVDLPPGGSVDFAITAQLPADYSGLVESSVLAIPPSGYVEANPADNSATDISHTERVFGDGFETPASGGKNWLLSLLGEG